MAIVLSLWTIVAHFRQNLFHHSNEVRSYSAPIECVILLAANGFLFRIGGEPFTPSRPFTRSMLIECDRIIMALCHWKREGHMNALLRCPFGGSFFAVLPWARAWHQQHALKKDSEYLDFWVWIERLSIRELQPANGRFLAETSPKMTKIMAVFVNNFSAKRSRSLKNAD